MTFVLIVTYLTVSEAGKILLELILRLDPAIPQPGIEDRGTGLEGQEEKQL